LCGDKIYWENCPDNGNAIPCPPTPPTDELERLIEECGNGITKGSGFNLSAIRLLAERVRGLENKLSVKLLDNTLARVADLTGRLEKLEETYFMEHNISNRVTTPEQTNPQARNPLTREDIEIAIEGIVELIRNKESELRDEHEVQVAMQMKNTLERFEFLRIKFTSYLEEGK
jgi:hypothetical protein